MTGFWVHLNAQLTNRPKGADSTRRKDAAARDGVWRVRETAEIRVPVLCKTDTRCEGSTQRATQTDQDTNKYGEGGGIFVRRICCLVIDGYDIDEERFVLWLALLAWRLQCFRVFRFSRSFFSFFLARTAGVDEALYRMYRLDRRRDQPDRTHHLAGSYFSYT